MLGGGLWLAVGLRMRGSLVDDCVVAGVQGRAIRLGAAGSLLSGKDVQLLQQRISLISPFFCSLTIQSGV